MSKRFLSILLTLLLALSLMPVSASAEGDAWMQFYVSPTGNDNGSGTKSSPFQTLERVRDEVRKYNKNMQGDIVVNMMPGRYEQYDGFELEVEDSGSNGFNVIWQGTDPNNLPVISGAKEVSGTWTEDENGIWHTKAENLEFARDIYINGVKGTRAKDAKKIFGNGIYTEEGKMSWDNRKAQWEAAELGFYVNKSKMGLYENPEDVELFWEHLFRITIFHVDDIIQDPKNDNQVIVIMDRTAWPAFRGNMNRTDAKQNMEQYGMWHIGFTVENAYELLDEPGEFYFNKKTKVLSYIPREGEDLNNAEVLVPQTTTDRLMFIHGKTFYDKVKNIQFKNVQFSHTSYMQHEYGNVFGAQSAFSYQSYMPANTHFSAITVDWADNLSFRQCVFTGLGAEGLQFREAVYDSEVIGCVFADIGGSGFMTGGLNQTHNTEPKVKEGPTDVAWSSAYFLSNQTFYNGLGLRRGNEDDLSGGSGWDSGADWVVELQEPYVMVEFDDDFTLESVDFTFKSNTTDVQRRNFEVILSKDKDLKESKVIASYGEEPADFKVSIPVGDGETWRYLTLRKTVKEPFALNGIYAWSYDKGKNGGAGVSRNCTISNNYFTRTAQENRSVFGIFLMYSDSFRVEHNTIYDVPYTGINVGWGWESSQATTSINNVISYNRMVDTMNNGSDGGGIYIFGNQYGTVMEGNYIRNCKNMSMALYFDAGACGITAKDTVLMKGGNNYFLGEECWDNVVTGLYSSDSTIQYVAENVKNGNSIEEVTLFDYSDRPDVVAKVEADAGLEDEWLWILDRVPEEPAQRETLLGMDTWEATMYKGDKGFMPSESRREQAPVMAKNIIDYGTFGSLPWNFDPWYKLELQYGIDNLNSGTNRTDDVAAGHQEELVNLDEAMDDAFDSVYHPSYDEMLVMCDEFASKATTAEYPKAAIDTFKKDVEAVKATNPQTRGDKGVAANHLEKIYQTLYNASLYPTLEGVVVENAKTTIDSENKKVTVNLPTGFTIDEAKIHLFPEDGASIPKNVDTIDYSTGTAIVPLYKASTGRYSFWTVELVESDEKATEGALDVAAANWVGGNKNVTKSNVKGAFICEPWWQPTMNKVLMDGNVSFGLHAERADTIDGYGIVFSAKTTDLEETYKELKNTYYMLKIKDASLVLSKVVSGEATTVASLSDVYFNYGDFNAFDISVSADNGYDRIKVTLNGETIINTLVDDPIGPSGYFGISTKNQSVKVR